MAHVTRAWSSARTDLSRLDGVDDLIVLERLRKRFERAAHLLDVVDRSTQLHKYAQMPKLIGCKGE